jgi:GxxExxY protein
MKINELSSEILRCAFKVHSALGPGLLESAYQKCLVYELKKNGFRVEVEKELPIIYEDLIIDCSYRMDIVVEDSIIIELKTVKEIHCMHEAQMLTYLKFSNKKLGLLLNYNVPSLKYGIRRFIM